MTSPRYYHQPVTKRWWACCLLLSLLGTIPVCALAQDAEVSGRVEFVSSNHGATSVKSASGKTFVWLTPIEPNPDAASKLSTVLDAHPKLVQKNKSFEPHVVVVPVGAWVEFPNRDPFFHNVFSLFDGKRFDLGLYEAGGTRLVHFDRPGISYIFCNIHPEMSAVVIALDTPYYAFAREDNASGSGGGGAGEFVFHHVPAERYRLRVWSERAITESLQAASREVIISAESHSLGVLRLTAGTPAPPCCLC